MDQNKVLDLKQKLSEQNRENSIFVPIVQNILLVILPTIFISMAVALIMFVMGIEVVAHIDSQDNTGLINTLITITAILGIIVLWRQLENKNLPVEMQKNNIDVIIALIISVIIIGFQLSGIQFTHMYLVIVSIISAISLSIGAILTYVRFAGDEAQIFKHFYNLGVLSQKQKVQMLTRKVNELSGIKSSPTSENKQLTDEEKKLIQLKDDSVLIYKLSNTAVKPTKRFMADNYKMPYERWSQAMGVLANSNVMDANHKIQEADYNKAVEKIINYIALFYNAID